MQQRWRAREALDLASLKNKHYGYWCRGGPYAFCATGAMSRKGNRCGLDPSTDQDFHLAEACLGTTRGRAEKAEKPIQPNARAANSERAQRRLYIHCCFRCRSSVILSFLRAASPVRGALLREHLPALVLACAIR